MLQLQLQNEIKEIQVLRAFTLKGTPHFYCEMHTTSYQRKRSSLFGNGRALIVFIRLTPRIFRILSLHSCIRGWGGTSETNQMINAMSCYLMLSISYVDIHDHMVGQDCLVVRVFDSNGTVSLSQAPNCSLLMRILNNLLIYKRVNRSNRAKRCVMKSDEWWFLVPDLCLMCVPSLQSWRISSSREHSLTWLT